MLARVFERLVKAAEKRPWTVATLVGSTAWVAAMRILGERWLSLGDKPITRSPEQWFLHVWAFYVALAALLGAAVARLTPTDWRRGQNLVSLGLLVGTLPPVIDVFIYGRGQFAYEYGGWRNVPWLLHLPPRVLPWGETVVLWGAVALMAAYATLRARSWWRGLALVAVSYFSGLWVGALIGGAVNVLQNRFGLGSTEWRMPLFVATAVLGQVVAVGAERRLLARIPQIVLGPLLCLLGAAMSGRTDGPVVLACALFGLVSIGFALGNDWYDRAEDTSAGRTTPIDGDAAAMLALLPLLAVVYTIGTRLELGLALTGFAVVSHAYHADPLRLKCVFPLSYKTEGLLGGLAVLGGAACDPSHAVTAAEFGLAGLVALSGPLALAFKDAKDVDADASAGVRTVFVVLERRGVARRKILVGAAAALLVSVAGLGVWVHGAGADLAWALAIAAVGALAATLLLAVRAQKVAVGSAMVTGEAAIALAIAALLAR